jgi:hypothetical protein
LIHLAQPAQVPHLDPVTQDLPKQILANPVRLPTELCRPELEQPLSIQLH